MLKKNRWKRKREGRETELAMLKKKTIKCVNFPQVEVKTWYAKLKTGFSPNG